jgi:hypothetical protein
MRFAYIDSQGNEVPIPGVDALALRIQLGAVGPETELYDAQADRWGAAESHEIFVTLARASEDQGFVAPPPPVRTARPDGAGSAAPDPAASATGTALGDEGDDEDAGELRFDLMPVSSEADSADAGAPGTEPGAEPEPSGPASEAGLDAPSPDAPFTFDLADDLTEVDAAAATAEADGPDLEVPAPLEAGADPDRGAGAPPDPVPPADDEGVLEFHGELELDLPAAGGGDAGGDGGEGEMLDLEPPLSEFEDDAPPLWMEQDGPPAEEEDGALLEFGPSAEEGSSEPAAPGAARAPGAGPVGRPRPSGPRARPSPPRRPSRRSTGGTALLAVGAVVLGVAGWFGWQALQAGPEPEPRIPDLPEVTIPAIPAELLPTFRDVGEAALAGMVGELETRSAEAGLPAEPRQDWLSGSYLANAGQYPDVVAYWEGIESFVAGVREAESALFHESYREELATRELGADTAAKLLERADSGFLATRRERWEAYVQMEDLVDASLALHAFLLENEGEIDYEPAAGGMSADPVLEAVPSTRELGNEMWSRVDQITEALDRLGTLDRVTTERLTAVLFDRIRRAGFR